jgi:hypothetical protein
MSSERQTQVTLVSLYHLRSPDTLFYILVPTLGAPMGMAPVTHVLFTRLVNVAVLGLSPSSNLLGPASSMPTQRTQSGSTVIDLCFLTGMFSPADHGLRIVS